MSEEKECIYCGSTFKTGEELLRHVKKEHIKAVQSAFFDGGFRIEEKIADWQAFDSNFQKTQTHEAIQRMNDEFKTTGATRQ